jgi:hypothetical protein
MYYLMLNVTKLFVYLITSRNLGSALSLRSQRKDDGQFLSHSRLTRGDPTPDCNQCDVPLTGLHVLQECRRYGGDRQILHLLTRYATVYEMKAVIYLTLGGPSPKYTAL